MLYSNSKSRILRNGPVFLHLVQTGPNGPVWMGPFLAKTVWSGIKTVRSQRFFLDQTVWFSLIYTENWGLFLRPDRMVFAKNSPIQTGLFGLVWTK